MAREGHCARWRRYSARMQRKNVPLVQQRAKYRPQQKKTNRIEVTRGMWVDNDFTATGNQIARNTVNPEEELSGGSLKKDALRPRGFQRFRDAAQTNVDIRRTRCCREISALDLRTNSKSKREERMLQNAYPAGGYGTKVLQ